MSADMKEGYLIWNASFKRPDIMYQDSTYYGGLHCKNTLEALIRGRWRSARVEYHHCSDTWYLEGIENGAEILWLIVRK